MTSVTGVLNELDRFGRLHVIGFTLLWPLLGLASTNVQVTVATGFIVLVVGVGFHLFGFMLNDVIDLPIDRTQPSRAADPLVRGTVSAPTILAFALVQIPFCFLLVWWADVGLGAYAALAIAFVGVAFYDIANKRTTNPILTDLVLGLSGSAFIMFGAFMSGTSPTPATLWLSVYLAVYFVATNSVHGGMRDIENDTACGAHTTARYLGMRFLDGGIAVPRRAALFCWSLQVALILNIGLLVFTAGYDLPTTMGVLVLSSLLALGNVRLMHLTLTPDHARWEEAFRLHQATLCLAPALVLAPMMGGGLSVFVVALFLLPMGLIEHAPSIVRWLLPLRQAGP